MASGAVLVFAFLVVFPFKLAAGWMNAERTEWRYCFIAVLIAGALGGGASSWFGSGLTWAALGSAHGLLALATVIVVSGFTNLFVLGTTFWRGVAISFVGAALFPGILLSGFWLLSGAASALQRQALTGGKPP